MKCFILAAALVLAFACIAASEPAETENEDLDDLSDLEDEEWLDELEEAAEYLESLREFEESRGYKDYMSKAKDLYKDIKKDKRVKAVMKSSYMKEAKKLYKDNPVRDAYQVYKGVKAGGKLLFG
uniref:Cytoinsectotoxin-4 n=1 Tax=Lachesana tarabaevi TaxID=379576 RepID=CTX4_LACTA|nr:RecName: Full=Cytoinsectotoxin-4; Short=CIT-4; Flags: Precursor [Lachesana tarabaevi]AOH73462.1 Cytoinsectotoxin-4a precursor [Lachesana tarabaevi]